MPVPLPHPPATLLPVVEVVGMVVVVGMDTLLPHQRKATLLHRQLAVGTPTLPLPLVTLAAVVHPHPSIN